MTPPEVRISRVANDSSADLDDPIVSDCNHWAQDVANRQLQIIGHSECVLGLTAQQAQQLPQDSRQWACEIAARIEEQQPLFATEQVVQEHTLVCFAQPLGPVEITATLPLASEFVATHHSSA